MDHFRAIVSLLVYVFFQSNLICFGQTNQLYRPPQPPAVKMRPIKRYKTKQKVIKPKTEDNNIFTIAGLFGSSSFTGETSLRSDNTIGIRAGANYKNHSLNTSIKGIAQSFNSGISDNAAYQGSLIYNAELFDLLAINSGVSVLNSNSRINAQTAAYFAGLGFFQTKNWGIGAKVFNGHHIVSVADDIESIQLSPYLYKYLSLRPIRLLLDLKLSLTGNSNIVNTTYSNEVYFASHRLSYTSYLYEFTLFYKEYSANFSYWTGVEYVTVRDEGETIRSLYYYYNGCLALKIHLPLLKHIYLNLQLAKETFYERDNYSPAAETKFRIEGGWSF